MSLKKKISITAAICFTLVIFSMAIIQFKTYTASPLALAAKGTARDIAVINKDDTLSYHPQNTSPIETIIFYQGALVTEDSYSYWAAELARHGYAVYLIHAPLNMAILAPTRIEKLVKKLEIDSYIVGGHSLGGVVSSRFANQHVEDADLKGVFFLASYPDKNGDLSTFKGKVLSVTATQDLVLNQQNYHRAKKYLPKQTEYSEIVGGNHSGFGSYGEQKGDGQATLANQAQQDELVTSLLSWLQDN